MRPGHCGRSHRNRLFHSAVQSARLDTQSYNLDQFVELLWKVPMDSISYHQERGDFEHWINDALKDPVLAKAVKKESERHDLIWITRERSDELWNRLR